MGLKDDEFSKQRRGKRKDIPHRINSINKIPKRKGEQRHSGER